MQNCEHSNGTLLVQVVPNFSSGDERNSFYSP